MRTVLRIRLTGMSLLICAFAGGIDSSISAETGKAQGEAVLQRSDPRCASSLVASAPIVAARQPGTLFRDCPFAPEMVIVPSGQFMMGAPVGEKGSDDNERPVHQVTIKSFAAGRYEVTFSEWDACLNGGGCNGYRPIAEWGRGRHPVINVSWDDAQAYVNWLTLATGKKYRLLTEAEWEYSARSGTTTPYNTGANISDQQANFAEDYNDETVPVGTFKANSFGLHDTHGNVTEMVIDCISNGYGSSSTDGSPNLSENCTMIVGRGGPPFEGSLYLRSASRWPLSKNERNNSTGFRVARVLN